MSTEERLPGLHHVTSIAKDPDENVSFYTDVLGLRLVKRTVNFDDISTYHLYYGDERGTPGTSLTFFASGRGRDGTVGRGQTTATAFVVPAGSLSYWQDRLAEHGVDHGTPHERFDERVLPLWDHDGQPLELVTGESDIEPWAGGPVPEKYAVRGFHSVTLHPTQPDSTAEVLSALGYELVAETDDRRRYAAGGDRAGVLDVRVDDGAEGIQGVGTVHHVAFRTADDETQAAWRERAADLGLRVTEQKDRRYFRSIYFREPGGILFEIATDGPGFTRDESVEDLGSELRLPPWLEDDRDRITDRLPAIQEAD